MYRTAHPSSAIQKRTASSVNVLREMWNRRSPPFIKSTTIYLPRVSQSVDGRSEVGVVQVLDVLEAISQVAEERMVEMLEHPAFANDVANALGPYDCNTA